MKVLSGCRNVAVKIFGMECLFGFDWTTERVRPWILETIDFFGPERCMFASHMPIGGVARSFQDFYGAYFDVVSDFSASDKQKLFHDTSTRVYKV
jgi:predicted TIM-barrel fold metal-dependent hydrolase